MVVFPNLVFIYNTVKRYNRYSCFDFFCKSWPRWRDFEQLTPKIGRLWSLLSEMTPTWLDICNRRNKILSGRPNDTLEKATWLSWLLPNSERARRKCAEPGYRFDSWGFGASTAAGFFNKFEFLGRAYVVFTMWLVLIWLTKVSRWVEVNHIA